MADGFRQTYGEGERLQGQGLTREFAHRAVENMREHIAPTIRETLHDAIRQHGGPASVVEQMGIQPGTKEYRSTLRTVERHFTQAGQQRGTSRLSEKYQQAYDKVLGKGVVDRIRRGEAVRTGELPKRGTIRMVIVGHFVISKDERDRTVRADFSADQFNHLMRDPLGAFKSQFSGAGHVDIGIDSMTLEYQPGTGGGDDEADDDYDAGDYEGYDD